jgi:hypothetical protein
MMIVDRPEKLLREDLVVGVPSGTCQDQKELRYKISDPSSVADRFLEEPQPRWHDRAHEVSANLDERAVDYDKAAAAPSSESESLNRCCNQLAPRAVRFVTDEQGRIVEHVFRYRAVSEKRRELCFLSREELRRAVLDANAFAESYASLHEDWYDMVDALFLSSSSEDEVPEEGEQTIQASTLCLTSSSARGLEFTSTLLQKHQTWVNRTLIRHYRQLVVSSMGASGAREELTSDEVAERLGERCRLVNRPSRHLAREMARGDEVQARLFYQGDDTWVMWKG